MNTAMVGYLKANLDTGEGDVVFTEFFERLSPLMKADLLKDWLYDITEAYEEARSEMYVEMRVESDLEKMESANGKS